ncbi:TetR/AcrR family transcriptional regulator, transcriptional repressor for nem operon [Frankia sp. Hr75.2]|nr:MULTISPECIES: TetR/AcrR family transcriptional regulator [unclassified Parafrankia]CAI7978802.1 TetR/AcrR family transcriptional regulator, transcriptional repressor for nem operon [Frankia sp. Hr75.2]SQD94370.1 TetR-family transcriptional regulator [Parafrankia sp. Ea1.12]
MATVSRERKFDADAVLDAAMELFWNRGYEATSVADLVERLGIGRASLYASFGSKHDLYLRALDRYVQRRDPAIVEELSQPGPVLPAVRQLVRRYADQPAAPGQRGCMVVSAALELMPHDAQVARRVEGSWFTLRVALTAALTRARAQGELAVDTDPLALADFLLVVLQGLRVVGTSAALDGGLRPAVEQALSLLR